MADTPTGAHEAVARLRQTSHRPQAYSALPLGPPVGSYMALDQRRHPTLFVPAEDRRAGVSLRTDTLSLRMGMECSLHVPGGPVQGRFHVLRCESTDEAEVGAFVLLADALLGRLARTSETHTEMMAFFRTLRRLFRVSPAYDWRSERQGLWGELLLMSLIGGAAVWAPFWHTDPHRRFDLSASRRRIEVKTTQGSGRAHTFSHRQLSPAGDEQIAVASLLLQESSNGLSLRTLIDQARGELADDAMQLAKLEAAARGAGMSDPGAQGPSFDAEAAEASLAWFWVHEVPRFIEAEPPGVSGTRYTVDLSTAHHIPEAELSRWLSAWSVHA